MSTTSSSSLAMSFRARLEASFVLVDEQVLSTTSNINTSAWDTSSFSTSLEGVQQIETAVDDTPPYAHDWRESTTGKITIKGRHFVDKYGRILGLRGVNLSGACKTPAHDNYEQFAQDHKEVTFVGRPFPLEEAPEHLARLRRWGLTFVRFLVTWEAVEHEGPGIYDIDYLKYIRALLSLFPSFGIVASVSMHQDVWSRYSGGSGAPLWTLHAVGFDVLNPQVIEETGVAWLKGVRGGGHIEEERGVWPCGYQKLAASTMATCFWAGDVFTPELKVKKEDVGGNEDIPVQKFLQERFLAAWEMVVKATADLKAIIGYEMMNEPHRGYIELPSLHEFDYNTDLHLSHVPSALQSFALASGHPTLVPTYTRSFPMPTTLSSRTLLNPNGVSVWRKDGPTNGECIWEREGVWAWDKKKNEPVVLRENYFVMHPQTGDSVDWYINYYYPFVVRFSKMVQHLAGKEKAIFAEAIPNEYCPLSWGPGRRPNNLVYAPHWYDLNALFRKEFGNFSVNVQGLSRGMFPLKTFYWGQPSARDNYSLQIGNLVNKAHEALGETPVVFGECGIPMDMNRGEAFHSDNWTWQAKMMDALLTALERSLVGFNLWNYNPDNNDTDGDFWNGENFSWFSRSRARALPSSSTPLSLSDPIFAQTRADLDQGGRILRSIVRPYAAKTAGFPVRMEYEMNTGKFEYEWELPKSGTSLTSNTTEFFIPSLLTENPSRELRITGFSSSEYSYDAEHQTLSITPKENNPGQRHKVVVELDPPLSPVFKLNTLRSDFGVKIGAVGVALLAVVVLFLKG